MEKHHKITWILGIGLIPILLWFTISFVKIDFNPFNWDQESRLSLVVWSVICQIIWTIVMSFVSEESDEY